MISIIMTLTSTVRPLSVRCISAMQFGS